MSTIKYPSTAELMTWQWPQFEAFGGDLQTRPLNAATVEEWLADWSALQRCVMELSSRLYVATTLNTADEAAEHALQNFYENIYPSAMQADNDLKKRLLASGLQVEGMQIPLRNMRTEADLFRVENLALVAEEQKLSSEYDKIIGSQTVTLEGKELTISQLRPIYQDPDRSVRERAWRAGAQRQLADRAAINSLWGKFLPVRRQMAGNAGKPDYRAYKWQEMLRFDYTPEDCKSFHSAIEEVVVPAALRIYERRAQRLGVSSLRPWDLSVDELGRPALRPFQTVEELIAHNSAIFHKVDPQLGEYFDTMVREDLVDLVNRKNKAPGAYCTEFQTIHRPFVFENAVGVHDDVQTLLHESGHAMHVFETAHLPYAPQLVVTMEFAEVASMGMELLGSPYLTRDQGGYYTPAEAARARIEHLEGNILFWPYMAVVDAFQHWVYENPDLAADTANCDATWGRLWKRFMPGVDWSGLEDVMVTGWHRKLHIHTVPFYYVEYGLAQLGAVQVWRNSLTDQAGAVAAYRHALSLGGTVSLPELFKAAGARLAFDSDTLREAVTLMEDTIDQLDR